MVAPTMETAIRRASFTVMLNAFIGFIFARGGGKNIMEWLHGFFFPVAYRSLGK